MNSILFKTKGEKNTDKKNVGSFLVIVCMFATLLIKCIFTVWGKNYLYADGAASYWEAFDSDDINTYADFQQYGILIDTGNFQ